MNPEKGVKMVYVPLRKFNSNMGIHYFTMEVMGYEFCSDDQCFSLSGLSVYYTISLQRGKQKWTVKRRFSDFDMLRQHFVSQYGGNDTSDLVFPELPPKTLFSVVDDEEFLQLRHIQLNEFATYMLLTANKLDLMNDEKLLEFFGLDPNAAEVASDTDDYTL